MISCCRDVHHHCHRRDPARRNDDDVSCQHRRDSLFSVEDGGLIWNAIVVVVLVLVLVDIVVVDWSVCHCHGQIWIQRRDQVFAIWMMMVYY